MCMYMYMIYVYVYVTRIKEEVLSLRESGKAWE